MWLSLRGLLANKQICNAVVNSYIDYNPDVKTLVIENTGVSHTQTARTETNLGWTAYPLDQNTIVLIARNTTSATLKLHGKVGYKNAKEVLKRYTEELYSNKQYGIIGGVLTKELLERIPSRQCNIDRSYWISETYEIQGSHGLYIKRMDELQHRSLWKEHGYEQTVECAMRPIAYLKKDILIEIDNPLKDGMTQEKAVRLTLPSK